MTKWDVRLTEDLRRITIDGEVYTVENIHSYSGSPTMIETEEGEEFYLFPDSEAAGKAARERWEEMARHDPKEFACIVGEKTLVAWALGQPAGPGSAVVTSLEAWLDVVADHPHEEWASYDHEERDVTNVSPELAEALGFTPTVAYRHN